MAGLLGAGLIGMLMGNGFLGGLAGLASIIGLLFQVALIGGLIWLAVRFFRRRSEPALASAGAPYARQGLGDTPQGLNPAGGGAAPRALGRSFPRRVRSKRRWTAGLTPVKAAPSPPSPRRGCGR